MYYDYDFYDDLDSTMMLAIRKVACNAFEFAKILAIAIVLLIYYVAAMPMRIYQFIKEERYLAKKAETDEQIRFTLWKEDANQIK